MKLNSRCNLEADWRGDKWKMESGFYDFNHTTVFDLEDNFTLGHVVVRSIKMISLSGAPGLVAVVRQL